MSENHISDSFQGFFFQKKDPVQKTSKVRMALALAKLNRGTLIQGLNSISSSSKSVAKLLQPQLACRLLELRNISHRLLREVTVARQPLNSIQVSAGKRVHDWPTSWKYVTIERSALNSYITPFKAQETSWGLDRRLEEMQWEPIFRTRHASCTRALTAAVATCVHRAKPTDTPWASGKGSQG